MSYTQKFKQILPALYENRGIEDSQVEAEFFHAWDILYERIRNIQKEEVSFLEIGADKGLWSIMFFLVCEELGKKPFYVTATLIDDTNDHYKKLGFSQDIFLNYHIRNTNLYKLQTHYQNSGHDYHVINGNSQDLHIIDTVKLLKNEYDLIFIDGDHTYEGAKKDIINYEPLCKSTLIFHDILPKERTNFYVQVYPAIIDCGLSLDREIIHSNSNVMGIGLKFYNR